MGKLLLMTSCISPYKGVPVLVLKNKRERDSHYYYSVKKYIQNSVFDKIVYVDNSNTLPLKYKELIHMASENGKKIEFLSFTGDREKMIKKGKSYGEGEIIDYALKNSVLLLDEDYFYKVSGRYFLKNNSQITRNLSPNINYFAPWDYKYKNKSAVDTVFFAVCKNDYEQYLSGANEKADDVHGYAFEHIIYEQINSHTMRYRYFNVSPQYEVPMQASTGIIPQYNPVKEVYKRFMLFLLNLNVRFRVLSEKKRYKQD